MQIARRGVLAAGFAGGAAAAMPMSASAQSTAGTAATNGGQASGFYRFRVGDALVTLVNDGVNQRPLEDGFVRNAELAEVQEALRSAFQPPGTVIIPFTTTVIEIGDRLVMVDAGIGEFGPPTSGTWMSNFQAAGYAPEDVDLLIVSHFHGDHIQGIRSKSGELRFPNAEIKVPAVEWGFWMDEGEMSRAPEGLQGNFKNARRVFGPIAEAVQQFEGEAEVAPGLTALPAHGHTPGHTAFILADGDDRLLIWSDTTNKPELFVRNPGWQAVFDMDGDQAAGTRRRMLDMATSERMRVAGYHFPFPANGYIANSGGSYRFEPAFWMPLV
jgi:glyoxylase-like metal-dependent hydrolase (beta-lactamase superfamily II)